MFYLKKIITPLILPPGIFIVILMVSGLWYVFRKNQRIGYFNIFISVFMWFFSITPISNLFVMGLNSELQFENNPTGDAIILLGGGVYGDAPDLSGVGVPYQSVQAGIITAVKLQKKLNLPIIVSGGSVFKSHQAEAPIISRFLRDMGVESNTIILESKSRDTFENAKYTSEICNWYNFKKPILVTSAYHMRRAVLLFRKFGLDVVSYPSIFPTWDRAYYYWGDYLPGNYKRISMALKEHVGYVYYKFIYQKKG